ncbi:MAG: PD-(D/E)XK nuclease family protein [Candidatus Omnitrophica bacterium]|nr:PD-(D/E)XK nuclease family protein [Candidatus Omnitrophota bacterium]
MDNYNQRVHTFKFTESFISRLADFFVEHYKTKGHDFSKLACVFPGKRPALFLKRELSRRLKAAYLPPQFLTIDELIQSIVVKFHSVNRALDLDHNYIIYQLARKHMRPVLQGRETFAQFLPWAGEILKFIDHLDLELVSSEKLRNIEANAQIGYAIPEDINRLLEHIAVLRSAYHDYMQEHKTFTRGYQYWWAAQNIARVEFPEFEEFLFCNFFYLHRSETVILEHLFSRGQARIFFQGDQRRWPALNRLSRVLDVPIIEGETVPTPQFDLKLYAASDDHIQATLVRDLLSQIKEPEKTVVVLPDPEPLIPLLSEISSVANDYNVSMGYPLQRSSLTSLFDFLYHAQISCRQRQYYAHDYLKVLRHPFIKNLRLIANASAMRVMVHKIEEMLTGTRTSEISGRLFFSLAEIENCAELFETVQDTLKHMAVEISQEDLVLALRETHRLFFVLWEGLKDFQSFASVVIEVLAVLLDKSDMKSYPLNVKIAQRMTALAQEFQLSRFACESFDQDDMFRIFRERMETEIISFHGSPLKGLQILGLFETRSLNFEHVIVLNVNEGVLPRLNIYEPLIPREVMIKLNLDRLELEEEIQRYQFMRLISSAKNVHLIYREGADKEKSRFIEELIWQEEKAHKVLNPVAVSRPGYQLSVKPSVKRASKTPAMIDYLKSFRFSASSVNSYLRNPFEFYQNYVLGLREKEDLLDEPENRQVGIFIHGLLENLFQRFVGRPIVIDEPFCQLFMAEFEKRFSAHFGGSLNADAFLLKTIMDSRLRRFLEVEQERLKFSPSKLLYIEKRFEDVIELKCGAVKFVYQVDRVDESQDATVTIIDYKTGSVDPMPKAVEKISKLDLSRESIRDHVKSFQIPLYVQYLDKHFPGRPINAAFYNLRTMDFDRFMTAKSNLQRDDINQAFMRALDFIISEILDPQVDFIEDDISR